MKKTLQPVPNDDRSTVYTSKKGEKFERFTVYLPMDLSSRIRLKCVKERRRMSTVIVDFAERGMAAEPPDQPLNEEIMKALEMISRGSKLLTDLLAPKAKRGAA